MNNIKNKLKFASLLLCFCSVLTFAFARNFDNCNHYNFKWFGIKIYDVYLCSDDIKNINPSNLYSNNFSLVIIYDKAFDKERLTKRSITEMQKYHTLKDQSYYYNKLLEVFVDVKKLDTIEAKYKIVAKNGTKKAVVEFYYNNNLTGIIEDKIFAEMFLNIWLHPKNNYKNMHKDLFKI